MTAWVVASWFICGIAGVYLGYRIDEHRGVDIDSYLVWFALAGWLTLAMVLIDSVLLAAGYDEK